MTQEEEFILLHRARALEQEALTEIHERFYTSIYRYISFRVDDRDTVEDLTSEVFLRLLVALRDRTAPQKTLRGWLYGVASNIVKEFYRQKKRANQTELNDSLPSNGKSPHDQLETQLLRENLQIVMRGLTEDQKNVLALRFGYEMPIREVAQTMGKSEGSVKMLQARAIASLSRRVIAGGAFA